MEQSGLGLVKRIDSYDIWRDPDGFRVTVACGSQPDQLVGCYETLKDAERGVSRDMNGFNSRW